MQKISNSPVQRVEPIIVGQNTNLPFANTAQTYFTNNTPALTAADFQTWKTANPSLRVLSVVHETGYNGVTGINVEYTDQQTSDLLNSLISQIYITGATSALLEANLNAWFLSVANSTLKPVRITLMIGNLNDGTTGYLIEYTSQTAYTGQTNSILSRLLFTDSVLSSAYSQYSAWGTANPLLKPKFLNNYIVNDGTNGIMIIYTAIGIFPSAGQILHQAPILDNSSDAATLLAAWKASNPGYSILRLTMTCDVLLVEYVFSGSTPKNIDISQSYYPCNADNLTGNTAYQVFKTANPTLKPVRATEIIWGDGTTGILAEYIN